MANGNGLRTPATSDREHKTEDLGGYWRVVLSRGCGIERREDRVGGR